MNSFGLPTLEKLQIKLVELAPEDAELIIALVRDVFGLREDLDELPNALATLAALFSRSPWPELPMPKKAALYIGALHTLVKLLKAHPDLVPRTQGEHRLNHTVAERPLMFTWDRSSNVLDPNQRFAGQLLQACLFVWRAENIEEPLPPAIIRLCSCIRVLLTKNNKQKWPEPALPREWLANLIFKHIQPDSHPLHSAQKGLKLLHRIFAHLPEKSSIARPISAPTTPSFIPKSIPQVHWKNPISLPVINLPSDEDDRDPVVEQWLTEDLGEAQNFSNAGQFARLREARYRTARENNFLPWSWGWLNVHDIKCVMTCMTEDTRAEYKVGKILCSLTMACAVDLKELLETRFVSTWDQAPGLQINITTQEWARVFPAFPGRFTPTPAQREALVAHQDIQMLPLPAKLVSELRSIQNEHGLSLGKLLNLASPDDAESVMRQWLSVCRERFPELRATPARLRRVIFDACIRSNGDDLVASLTVNSAQFAPSVGYYYYSAPKDDLKSNYCQQLNAIGFELPQQDRIDDVVRFGSRLFLVPEKHAEILGDRMHGIIDAVRLPMRSDYIQLSQAHRSIACYTAWLLQCATGHRAAEQYSFASPTLSIDEGWAILRDKVVDDAHRARLVRLAPIARAQLHAYCQHLRALAQRLQFHHPDLAKQIGRMSDIPDLQGNVPLLFLLPSSPSDSVQKLGTQEVMTWLKPNSEWPSNLPRHWFISELRKRGIPSEWVSGAAGHIQAGQQLWAASMLWPPSVICSQWDETVDAWLKELGFEVQQGLQIINKKQIPEKLFCKELNANPRLKSNEQQRLELKMVKQLIRKSLGEKTLPEFLASSELQSQVRQIIAELPDLSQRDKQQKLNILARFLRIKTGKRTGGFVLDCEVESAPVDYDHLLRVRQGQWLRDQLPKVLPDDISLLPLNELLAWCQLALCVESGIVEVSYLQSALEAIRNGGLRYLGSDIWLEYEQNQRLIRWWPGPLSTLLLLQAHSRISLLDSSGARKSAPIDMKAQLRNIVNAQFQVGFLWPESRNREGLAFVVTAMRAWQLQHWPGVLAAYTRGEIKPWAVPQNNLLRLLTAKRNMPREGDAEELASNLIETKAVSKSFVIHEKALSELRQLLSKYRSGSNGAESATALSKSINEKQPIWATDGVCDVVRLAGSYAQRLFAKQTKNKHYAQSTILDYVLAIAKPLMELCWEDHILDYDAEDFGEVYLGALDYSDNQGGRCWRASRIAYFHRFLVDEYDVPEVDFASLDEAFSGIPARVHAQILRYEEYHDALQLLKNDPYANREEQELQALALLLVFRFGMRIGECFRLRINDIVFLNDIVVIYIRQSKWGRPKSRAGFRQLPCWTLADDECANLRDRINALRARYGASATNTPIFCSASSADQLLPASRMTRRLLQALKMATGNLDCRIHHARHTFASAIPLLTATDSMNHLSCIQNWFPGGVERAQHIWLGPIHPTRRLLHAASSHLGHAQLTTTLNSYTHSLDLLLAAQIVSMPLQLPVIRKIALLSGIKESAIKGRRHREPIKHIFLKSIIATTINNVKLPAVEELLDEEPLASLPKRTVTIALPIRSLHLAIVALKRGEASTKVANHFGLSEQQVTELIMAYQELESLTAYNGFEHLNSSEYVDKGFFRQLSDKVQGFFTLNSSFGEQVLCIWKNSYSPAISGLAVSDPAKQAVWIGNPPIFKLT